jgi:hypothetical protein
LASISNGKLTALKPGSFTLRASSSANSDLYTEKELEIFPVEKAVITLSSKTLKVNDKLELSGKLTDQNGNTLTGINPVWKIGNQSVAEIIQADGKYFLKGKQTGKSWLFLEALDLKSIRDSVLIEVFPESEKKKVFISIKTSENTIVPRQSFWVDQFDLTSKVDRAQKSYGLAEIPFVSLAHAIAAAFKNTDLNADWAFRDDAEGDSKLYLWKIPEVDEGSVLFHFGYGGSQSSGTNRKAWIVMLNQQPVVNGFDQIKVNNNDEILIYHIADNSLPWTVTHLTSGNDSIKTNQKVEVQLKRYSCSMDLNRNIAIKSSEVIASQFVLLEAKDQSKISKTTDEWGKAIFSPEKSGDYLIKSGIDVSKVHFESITGNQASIKNQLICKIQPNPFTESIWIESSSPVTSVDIFNTEGKCVYHSNGQKAEIGLSEIHSGVYVIRILAANRIFQQKIIKN